MNIEESTSPAKSLNSVALEDLSAENDERGANLNQCSPKENSVLPKEVHPMTTEIQESSILGTEERSAGVKIDEEYFRQTTHEKIIEEQSPKNGEEEEGQGKPEIETKIQAENSTIEAFNENIGSEKKIEEEIEGTHHQISQEEEIQDSYSNKTPQKQSIIRQSISQLELNENFRLVVMSFEKSLEKPRGSLATNQADQAVLFRSDEKNPLESHINRNDKSLLGDLVEDFNQERVFNQEDLKSSETLKGSYEKSEVLEARFDNPLEEIKGTRKSPAKDRMSEEKDENLMENTDQRLTNDECINLNTTQLYESAQNIEMNIESYSKVSEEVSVQNDFHAATQESKQTDTSMQYVQLCEDSVAPRLQNHSELMEEETPQQQQEEYTINQEHGKQLSYTILTSSENAHATDSNQLVVEPDNSASFDNANLNAQNKNETRQRSIGQFNPKVIAKKKATSSTMTSIATNTNLSKNSYSNRFADKQRAGEIGKTNSLKSEKLKIVDKKASNSVSIETDEDKKILSEVFAESRPQKANMIKKRARDQIAKSPERSQNNKNKEVDLSKKIKLSVATNKTVSLYAGNTRLMLENTKKKSSLADPNFITQKNNGTQSKENFSTEVLKCETAKQEGTISIGKSSVPSKVTPKRFVTCGICSAELQVGQIRTLACLHKFHQECFSRVNKKKVDCPLCNGSLKVGMIHTHAPVSLASKKL